MDSAGNHKYNLFRILFYPLTRRLSLLRTLYFNLHYFPLKTALKFPVFIHTHVRLKKVKGSVELSFRPLKPGAVHIGQYNYGFQTKNDHTIWEQLGGTVIFGKRVMIGKGTFLSIGSDAVLKFGDNIAVGGNDKLICRNSIEIGSDTIISWDVQIIDTNFHPTINTVSNTINRVDKPIVIGHHNWLCFGSVILKGSVTPNHCIVSTNTTIRSDFSRSGENIILDDHPEAQVTVRNVRFDERTMDDPLVRRKNSSG